MPQVRAMSRPPSKPKAAIAKTNEMTNGRVLRNVFAFTLICFVEVDAISGPAQGNTTRYRALSIDWGRSQMIHTISQDAC